jgi:hypothetical protein
MRRVAWAAQPTRVVMRSPCTASPWRRRARAARTKLQHHNEGPPRLQAADATGTVHGTHAEVSHGLCSHRAGRRGVSSKGSVGRSLPPRGIGGPWQQQVQQQHKHTQRASSNRQQQQRRRAHDAASRRGAGPETRSRHGVTARRCRLQPPRSCAGGRPARS